MNFAIPNPDIRSDAAALSTAAVARHHKLTEAAQQFEGMLLQEMLKPMKEHGFCQDDGSDAEKGNDEGSGFGDTLSSFGTETMATAIAKSGGLGIAKRVIAQVDGERASHLSGQGQGEFQNNTPAVLKSFRAAPMS